jgi:hypothetical protein
MLSVVILINGNPIMARSATNQESVNSQGEIKYQVDDGSFIFHRPEDGAVKLAQMLLSTIKESSNGFKTHVVKAPVAETDKAPVAEACQIEPDIISLGVPLLSVQTLASQLHVKPQTLAVWRARKKGPKHVKLGNTVYYPVDGVKGWLETRQGP